MGSLAVLGFDAADGLGGGGAADGPGVVAVQVDGDDLAALMPR
jgi:hypothetical protein